MPKFIVALESDVWLAPCGDDPCGRTLVKSSAKVYPSEAKAQKALRRARELRAFPRAAVEVSDV